MQQGLLQLVQRFELALVEGFEASGFFKHGFKSIREFRLCGTGRNRQNQIPQVTDVDLHECSSVCLFSNLLLDWLGSHQVVTKILIYQCVVKMDRHDTASYVSSR